MDDVLTGNMDMAIILVSVLISAVLFWHVGRSARKASEKALTQSDQMLKAATRALSVFVAQTDRHALFTHILEDLNALSQSEFGFIGILLSRPDGTPYIRTLAISNIAWNEETRLIYGEHLEKGLEFNHMDSLFGQVVRTGEVFIANNPATDTRRCGLPEGHPPLNAFLGLPLHLGSELVGMVGLANRPGGYDDVIVSYLEPMQQICANVIGSDQNNQRRERAEENLLLAGKVFENSLEGILVTDAHGNIQSVNPAFCQITGYSEADVVGENPRILKSEHHNTQFYEKMWDSITATGKWQGELWNRRKSGDTFPIWQTISAIKGDAGEIIHYVAIFFDITERKLADQELEHQAQHDALTGLPNRMLFDNLLRQILREEHRAHKQTAVVFMDLDRFKEINDTLGHPVGDLLLQEAARRLRLCVRESDVLARMGGDEFTLILLDVTGINDAAYIAEKIIRTLNEPFFLQGNECHVGASIGISMYPTDGSDAETLIKCADTAMYRAKECGRNNYQFFTSSMGDDLMLRMQMKKAIDEAIAKGEFQLYYQPKINLATGRCIGAEALIRWVLENNELIMPDTFLPLAEETGQIIEIGIWVLHEACHQLKAWHESGYEGHSLAVNLSARQFESDTLIEQLVRVLEETGLDPSLLELEVTETCAMKDSDKSIEILESIKKLGIKVSIDDFGTGYSSLSYLKKFPVNTLKVDRSFVRDIPDDRDDMAITTAIIQMASNLEISVVAEGVETQEQADFLTGKDCLLAQGYFFSRPLPVDEYMIWLKAYESMP
ncbi:MAG: diguanylate cyclase [Zetaproteobacteria bacterium CG_4_9_14_3_um_filter_53_7]|nr:MAG: diguanylate cyclase [Zetaproteobacteria bacterium CG_4_9_14_3_um_filter_53_7]